jgi:hypothetical protein
MEMTVATLFVGAVLGIAFACAGLAIVGIAFFRSQEEIGRAEPSREGCRREAGLAGCQCKGSRPAEPDRETLLRVFRDTGWIDIDTARRYSR